MDKTNNPALSLQPDARMHRRAAESGTHVSREASEPIIQLDSRHLDNHVDAPYGNTTHGGNRSTGNSDLDNLNVGNIRGDIHGDSPSNIVYDDNFTTNVGYPGVGYPKVGYPNVGYPNVGYPNVGNPSVESNNVGYSGVNNATISNAYVGNTYMPHEVSHEYNRTPLATRAITDDVSIGRGRVDPNIAPGATGLINSRFLASDTTISDKGSLWFPTPDVPLGRVPVDATITSSATGLISPPTSAYNTTISDTEPHYFATNPEGQATSLIHDRYMCFHEGCFKDFGRVGDLERHWSKHQPPGFHCPFEGCGRKGAKGFARKDNWNKHLKKCKFQPKS